MEKYFDWSRILKDMDKPIFFIYSPRWYGLNKALIKQAINKLYGDKCKEAK